MKAFWQYIALAVAGKAPKDFIGIGYRLYTRHVAALAIAVGAMLVGAIIGRA